MAVLVGVCTGLPAFSWAASTLTVSAEPDYEHNSNIYDLPGGTPIPGRSDSQHGDNYFKYLGAVSASDEWADQLLSASLDGGVVRYSRLTELNHDQYNADLNLKWLLSRDFNGTFDVTRSHSMVPFSSLLETQSALVLQTDQRELVTANYLVNSDWRLEGSASSRKTDTSPVLASNLGLKENGGSMTLRFVRDADLTGGVTVGYARGRFNDSVGATAAPTYDQINALLVMNYKATGLSSFVGTAGWTDRRSSDGTDNISGLTGSLDYQRQLTGKTSFDLGVSRVVDAALTSTGSEIDTIANLGVTWQATYKLAVVLGYSYTQRKLPGQGLPLGTDRTDKTQYGSATVQYQWLRWLSIKPYANIQTRNSNTPGAQYNATVYGVSLVATWKKQ